MDTDAKVEYAIGLMKVAERSLCGAKLTTEQLLQLEDAWHNLHASFITGQIDDFTEVAKDRHYDEAMRTVK